MVLSGFPGGVMEIKQLSFAADSPPLSVIVAAELSGVSLVTDSSLASGSAPFFVLSDGRKLHGTDKLLRFIGCTSSNLQNFYGATADESNQIDELLQYARDLSSGPKFENACKYIDEYLEKRTFTAGHSLSIADIAVWSGLAGVGLRWESLRKSKKYQNLVRWFNSISSEYDNVLSEVLAKHVTKRGGGGKQTASKQGTVSQTKTVSSDASDKGTSSNKATAEVDLPGAEVGKVCLRFAPEPSGYLHIGHAKAALSNQLLAQQYQGKVILRFDDTNPTKESNKFKDSIVKDLETLGFNYDKVTHTSDYFPQMMEMAENLINQGKAYVDDTPEEKMKEDRMDGIESKCRSNSIEENLKLWEEMIAGSERGRQCCLRGKLDMQDPNKSLRDPVYYRCHPDVPHPRTESKYKLYPTYDFACPFVDSLEGITHALRASEYYDRNAQYDRIQADMGIRKVEIYEFSRLNFVYTLLSKRDLSSFVDEGKVDGWDDPRFPTVQGIVRRGLKIEALIQFIDEQRASKNLNLMEWDKLWSINKKIIDPVCPRHTAVIEEKRVLLTLTDGPEKPFVRIIQRHKKYEGAGEKNTTYTKRIWIDYADAACISAGEEITLMDWGNAIVKEIEKDQEGNIKNLTGVLHLEGSVKTTKLKLTWLPDTNELVSLKLHEFYYLITKKKLEKKKDPRTGKKKKEDFRDFLNPCTEKVTAALGDSNMRNLKRGDVVQLERKGYFRCDVPFVGSSKPIVLFAIPDGRQQTVSK